MIDSLETVGKSLVQHGPHNERAYLMKLHPDDLPGIVVELNDLACSRAYTKIFAKVPLFAKPTFLRSGYRVEAVIENFYEGEEDVCFMGRYLTPERMVESQPERLLEVRRAAEEKEVAPSPPLPENLDCRAATPADADEMAALYREVFATYPFPIHDPGYLIQSMSENVAYFGIWESNRLLALASSEIDYAGQNAEMTDFATLPSCRGRGLATYLLSLMEREMGRKGIRTAYTIARAYSYGMNLTFAKKGYEYAGTLTHNTQISGSLESMNVWHKVLA